MRIKCATSGSLVCSKVDINYLPYLSGFEIKTSHLEFQDAHDKYMYY